MIKWNGHGGCPVSLGDFVEIKIFTNYGFMPTYEFKGVVDEIVLSNRIWTEYDKRFHNVFYTRNERAMTSIKKLLEAHA